MKPRKPWKRKIEKFFWHLNAGDRFAHDYYRTSAGIFLITEQLGRWHIIFEDESLGGYVTPRQAADDLAGGYTFSPGPGIDTS